jgi:hypothetical protein
VSARGFFHKLLLVGIALPLSLVLYTAIAWWQSQKSEPEQIARYVGADASGVVRSIFTTDYPNNDRFQEELELLRATKRLDPQNLELINRLIRSTSLQLTMPPGVLWCLLFQESRFNHLTGLKEDRRAKGLGQFAYFSFHEINHNLDRFTDANLKMFISVLGWDMRPIAPLRDQINAPGSYFYIPTAVTSSAAFLNNRFHQLKRVLDRRGITYSPDLLWLYSAMAYNKGTRTVLSFWNKSLNRGGRKEVERLLLEPGKLFDSLNHYDHFVGSLAHIWPKDTAKRYADELTQHMKQIKECSVDRSLAESLEVTGKPKRGGAR